MLNVDSNKQVLQIHANKHKFPRVYTLRSLLDKKNNYPMNKKTYLAHKKIVSSMAKHKNHKEQESVCFFIFTKRYIKISGFLGHKES